MRLLPCGDVAVLAEVDSLDDVLALHAALLADPLPGVLDLVPAARTVLVRIDPSATTVDDVSRRLVAVRLSAAAVVRQAEPVEIPVVYDGEDLPEVARLTGLGGQGVIDAHTSQTWRVAFAGFSPGFAYLAGSDERLHVARRERPRKRVPAGVVALAGEFSGIYPRESPGGWQLIGHTAMVMWNLDRDPPALLRPGMQVRFTDAR